MEKGNSKGASAWAIHEAVNRGWFTVDPRTMLEVFSITETINHSPDGTIHLDDGRVITDPDAPFPLPENEPVDWRTFLLVPVYEKMIDDVVGAIQTELTYISSDKTDGQKDKKDGKKKNHKNEN